MRCLGHRGNPWEAATNQHPFTPHSLNDFSLQRHSPPHLVRLLALQAMQAPRRFMLPTRFKPAANIYGFSTAAFDWAGLGWRLCQSMQALVAEVRQLGRAALSESGSWRLRLGVMEAHSQELPDLRFIPKPMPWLKTFTVRRYTNLEWKNISHLQTSQSFDQSCIFLNAPSWLWALVGCPLTHTWHRDWQAVKSCLTNSASVSESIAGGCVCEVQSEQNDMRYLLIWFI